jgi:DNA polymerase-3 subunit delta
MRLRFEQLESHLQKGLLPIYLISGDEPLQLMEAADLIRASARAQGFSEREVLDVVTGFDWGLLSSASGSMSLFAERKIIDLRLPSAKPGSEGARVLVDYCSNLSMDNLLLVSCGKLDQRQQQSKWFKALEDSGAVLQVWPVGPRELPDWIGQRMKRQGLSIDADAAQLLSDRVEGNLLAAAQEIDKLVLLYGTGNVDIEMVEQAVSNSSRFDVFELVDTALSGDAARTSRIIDGLRGEGVEPVLLSWALAREVRSLASMAAGLTHGESVDAVLRRFRVWQKRQTPVRAGLQRHNLRRWQQFLKRAAHIDRIIKGAEPGNPWDELLQLSLMIAGIRLV